MILHAMMLDEMIVDEMILECLHNSSSQDPRSTIVIALSLRGYSIVGNRKKRLRHQGFAPAGWIQIALPPPETMWMSSTVVRSTGCLLKVMWVALLAASGASA
jgi:hypothetical protein